MFPAAGLLLVSKFSVPCQRSKVRSLGGSSKHILGVKHSGARRKPGDIFSLQDRVRPSTERVPCSSCRVTE